MNYIKFHLGDYAKKAWHLSMEEEGCYFRLLRKYYDDEKPFPADVATVQRLVGVRSDAERELVVRMLEEFFELEADGWHHGRCDEEIAACREKGEKARRSANARWSESERNADAMRTHSDGNAKAMLATTPLLHYSKEPPISLPSEVRSPPLEDQILKNPKPQSTTEGDTRECARARRLPADWAPSDSLLEWTRGERPAWGQKRLDDVLASFRDYWTSAGGQAARKVDWDAAWRNWVRKEGEADSAAAKVNGKGGDGIPWWATDEGIKRKGEELGLSPRPGEGWQDFKGRINEKIRGVAA